MRPLVLILLLTLAACDTGATTAPLGEFDGYVPDGETISPFADVPAVTRLDPALRDAVRDAATDARADGIELHLTTGWRSARYQRVLLDEAIATRGPEEARRWVDTPDDSAHVTGDAVDVGPTDAADWLGRHGTEYGLCQIFANEMWHFELATEPGGQCPPMRADAS